jgi:general secretion pathway protein G
MNLEKRQERFQGRFRDWLRARFARLPARGRDRSDAGQQGFTLVEMLVVITIIGLIMGLIGPRVLNYLSESKVKAAKIQLQSFGSALDLFYLDAGRFPSTSEGLTALVQRTPGIAAWNGPYLKGGNVPNDPWNHPYVYRSPGERSPYEIVSYGADGQEGGAGAAADISTENLVSAKNE